jgi:hypothetical protein
MQKLVTPALMSAILSAGYNIDYIDADAINTVGLGTHQILILPPTDRIPVDTLKKIVAWSERGGKVLAVGHVPTSDPEGNPSPEITELSKAIKLVPNTSELAKALDSEGDPDLKLTTSDDHTKEVVGFIRRKLPTADIYFVVNTSNLPIKATMKFATSHPMGEAWAPDTGGTIADPNIFPIDSNGAEIILAPYESRVFVFHMGRGELGGGAATPTITLPDISTDWQVTFTSTKETETEPTLTDWTINPATLYYSGEAIYARDFTLTTPPKTPLYLEVEGGQPLPGAPNSPPEHPALGSNGLPDPHITRTGPGMHAYYDPPIHEAALVFLNGQRVGSLWHPPYRLDVSKFLKPGENHIEIHVYNTALNAWSTPLQAPIKMRRPFPDAGPRQSPPIHPHLGTIHLMAQKTK